MKKLLIGLLACLCFTSCIKIPVSESNDTLIVTGSTSTYSEKGITAYKISAHSPHGWRGIIGYKAKSGTFEIGDTVVIVKK